jgi:RNA 2',3'-cyclic 3'-phosphodiesterase
MRLFAAIPVSGEAQAALGGALEQLRATDMPVKWTRPDALHLTIKFLGDVMPDQLASLCHVLEDAGRGTPILTMSLTEVGGFPAAGRAKVLWAGLEAEPALELLVDRVERGCVPLGFPVEGRAFRPHVTLGRLRPDRRLTAAEACKFEAIRVEGAFSAAELVLFESIPGSGGPRYVPRHVVGLGR